MTGQYEDEYEEVWQLCEKCHTLLPTVTYSPGSGNSCDSCRS